MLKGFKDFIMQGDLVDLAVALIMALALKDVVTALVTVIMDIIGKVGGTPSFSTWIPGGVHVGEFLTQLIAFLILAAAVYFMVIVPYQKLKARMVKAPEEEVEPEVLVLQEIRDLLQRQQGGAAGTQSTTTTL